MNYIFTALIGVLSLVGLSFNHSEIAETAKSLSVGASQSISALTELTSLSHNDVLPITDTANATTKKLKWGTATATMKTIFDPLYSPIFSTSAGLAGLLSDETGSAGGFVRATSPTLGSPTLTTPVINVGSDATGDIYYRNAGVFTRLPIADGYLRKSGSGIPEWDTTGILTNPMASAAVFNATTTFSGPTTGALSALYGDGSDGDVTVTSGTTTITRDMYYNNLTINAGATTTPNGFRIFVKNTLTVNGGISGDGNNGTAGTNVASCIYGACPSSASIAGVGGTSTHASLGRAPYGGNGGNGGSVSCNGADGTAGTTGTLTSYLSFTLNSGGTGGNGGAGAQTGGCSYTPAVGAGSTSPSTVYFKINNLISAFHPFGTSTHIIAAGASGGGGGGSGASCSGCSGPALNVGGAGGGAGANGNPIQIFARTVTISSTGVISSRGGNGGNGGNGGSVSGGTTNLGGGGGGGGAGGSGGWIQIITSSYTNSGSLSVVGGTGGGKGTGGTGSTGNGSDGTDGANGNSGISAIIIQ